jgi:hypothetical protein
MLVLGWRGFSSEDATQKNYKERAEKAVFSFDFLENYTFILQSGG